MSTAIKHTGLSGSWTASFTRLGSIEDVMGPIEPVYLNSSMQILSGVLSELLSQ